MNLLEVRPHVLVVDRHASCRDALNAIVSTHSQTLGSAGEPVGMHAAVSTAQTLAPDVVLMGIYEPAECEIIARIRDNEAVQVLALLAHEDGGLALRVLEAGAMGCLPITIGTKDLVDACARVARGELVFHQSIGVNALKQHAVEAQDEERRNSTLRSLTEREREVLELLSEGVAPKEMARRLFVSRRTVEFHLCSAYRKLGVHCRMDAVRALSRLREASSAERVNGDR